ncbi:MAG TPA: hypothetical protein PKE12_09460 [Kiritimatiellia bacterium]|nr:hypothetical protein [Kiritimatiellia bacterium]
MKIIVAGRDRTDEMAADLQAEASRMERAGLLDIFPPEISALRLLEAKNHAEYLDRFADLARRRAHVDTLGFRVPRRSGPRGAIVFHFKRILWKLLRYQHDRMAYRQNLVNSNLIALVELQAVEIAELKRRVKELENRPP